MTHRLRKMKRLEQPQVKFQPKTGHHPEILRHLIWTLVTTPPPIESPPKAPELPPIVVGYNPRKTGRYNLRPNPKAKADSDFPMLNVVTAEGMPQTQD